MHLEKFTRGIDHELAVGIHPYSHACVTSRGRCDGVDVFQRFQILLSKRGS
jgi:hypothetical protein